MSEYSYAPRMSSAMVSSGCRADSSCVRFAGSKGNISIIYASHREHLHDRSSLVFSHKRFVYVHSSASINRGNQPIPIRRNFRFENLGRYLDRYSVPPGRRINYSSLVILTTAS